MALSGQDAHTVVVGSGPGGATLARQLSRAGKRVTLLERGRDYRSSRLYGTYLGAMAYTDRRSFLFTREGLNVIRPLMAGGATSMYCGCAARPPAWLASRYRVDVERHVDETIAELGIAPLPAEHRGAASTRIAEAAGALGQAWEPVPKLVDPARGRPFRCGARCMLGCRCGAKWSAAECVDEAVAAGCRFRPQTHVHELIVEDGAVAGVRAGSPGGPIEVRARTVVLSAGGIGTPLLLRRAGLAGAAEGLGMDTTVVVYGAARAGGNGDDPPMTYAWADEDAGVMLSTLVDPWFSYPLIAARSGWRYPLTWRRWGDLLGVMVKLKDDLSGRLGSEREIEKPLTAGDRERLEHGTSIARRILGEAGAESGSIYVSPLRGTHPCATARIGDLLDTDLQTEIPGLYVCDASAFPEPLGRPTVLTIIGLAKRLAAHLAPP
jgi:choline dehydrogenase-like flavoprotein